MSEPYNNETKRRWKYTGVRELDVGDLLFFDVAIRKSVALLSCTEPQQEA